MPLSVRKGFQPWGFAVRRVFRIYPGLLAAFGLLAAQAYLFPGTQPSVVTATWRDWVANLLLLQDFLPAEPLLGVTWTLIIEFAWYGLFALAWTFAGGARSLGRLSSAMAVLVGGLTVLSFAIGHRLPLGRIGMVYAAIIGAQACQWFQDEIAESEFRAVLTRFVVVMTAANLVAFGWFHHPNLTLFESLFPWLAATALFVTVIRRAKLVRGASWPRSLTFLGQISFSIYLLHSMVLDQIRDWTADGPRIVAAAAATVALAAICFRVVEKPGIAAGRRVEAWLAGRRPGPLASGVGRA
jgi:peptidoglycan/LPS O-acetylase OafA/YrhL